MKARALPPRRDDLSREEFARYARETQMPLVARFHGLRRLLQLRASLRVRLTTTRQAPAKRAAATGDPSRFLVGYVDRDRREEQEERAGRGSADVDAAGGE